jgi:CxxC-x17-CxxC domain-containing protein
MGEITFFAKTNFRNQDRAFGIKTDDRRRHVYAIGKTGMGKTNMLENMAIQDIQNGHGIAFVDPHGDSAEKLIRGIPANRINDVIYFNPADMDFPIAFNVLEKVDLAQRHLVVSGLIGVFKKIWADSWGPRLEYILRNAILALLEYPGSTLLGVTRILVDKKYREKVVDKITDPVVKSFWVDEFTKWNDKVLQEVISPIQNKVGQFLSSSLIRNIVGQTTSSFDIRQAMDDRKILILNLSKGRIGEDNSALLGAMMITKIQLAAMGRVDIPEETRKDFYLYVDEFQNFATESFANILSEARKYRLNLILANQYVTQIQEEVRDAIFGNCGTIISFRVGAVDSEFLEKEFSPVFLATDIVNLAKYNIYLKLMIDGIAGDAFSATTLPPIDISDTEANESKVIKISRERYTSKREEVEEKISRWAGMLPVEDRSKMVPPKPPMASVAPSAPVVASQPVKMIKVLPPEKKVVLPDQPKIIATKTESKIETKTETEVKVEIPKEVVEKVMYDSKCDTCDIEIKVPFPPDGSRPTFCKECLKDYQRAMAKARAKEERKVTAENPTPIVKTVENEEPVQKIEPKSYSPKDKPLTLSQMQHMAPRKFGAPHGRSNIDLSGVRTMIGNIKKGS